MTRVLIAVDETEESVHAAKAARELFGTEAEYLAVSVADEDLDADSMPWWRPSWGIAYPVPYGRVFPYPAVTGHDQLGRSEGEGRDAAPVEVAQRDARSTADRSGIPGAETVGQVGDPADAVTRVAEDRAADVIVVGSRNRGWLDRLFDSSVSKEVLEHAHIPVLVVRYRPGDEPVYDL
jgi:nucleotide-binding universal stress UspA family protein